jgi:hypothetical protein
MQKVAIKLLLLGYLSVRRTYTSIIYLNYWGSQLYFVLWVESLPHKLCLVGWIVNKWDKSKLLQLRNGWGKSVSELHSEIIAYMSLCQDMSAPRRCKIEFQSPFSFGYRYQCYLQSDCSKMQRSSWQKIDSVRMWVSGSVGCLGCKKLDQSRVGVQKYRLLQRWLLTWEVLSLSNFGSTVLT